eukprot:2618418-Rhodomonas_salina.1
MGMRYTETVRETSVISHSCGHLASTPPNSGGISKKIDQFKTQQFFVVVVRRIICVRGGGCVSGENQEEKMGSSASELPHCSIPWQMHASIKKL